MNIPRHASNVTKYSNFLISVSFKFRTRFFNYYTQILMKKQSRVYLLIIKFIAIIKGPTMSILLVNISKTKYCVHHNGVITWNSLPYIFKVNVPFSMFKRKARNFLLEKYQKILMLGATISLHFFLTCIHQLFFQRNNCVSFRVLYCKI